MQSNEGIDEMRMFEHRTFRRDAETSFAHTQQNVKSSHRVEDEKCKIFLKKIFFLKFSLFPKKT